MFRFLILSLVIYSFVLGYEIPAVFESKHATRVSAAKERINELHAKIQSNGFIPLSTNENHLREKHEELHLTGTTDWFVQYVATSGSNCGVTSAIYDSYAYSLTTSPMNGCYSTASGQEYYKTTACQNVQGGVNLIATFYSDPSCTTPNGNPNGVSFAQSCSGSTSISYSCANGISESDTTPWTTINSGQSGYITADYAQDGCSGAPNTYFLYYNNVCHNYFEYSCPNGNGYSTSDCNGAPFTYKLKQGCISGDYYTCFN